jgi:hypothetical protein
MTAPKLFISYSWSNADHEEWVLNLAKELCESGVDVILDKWDLKKGHDSVAFMEKMVTDKEIKKVGIVCDKVYAEKADGRAGGVGTETQIISREVYEKQDQEKFVAILSEKDANGKPFLPTYYKPRIYIDLSEPDKYSEKFEELLRWIFDKPLHVKPEIGPRPSFLDEGEHVSLGTTVIFKRCIDALKNNKSYAAGAYGEYCNVFTSNLERFRLSKPEEPFDEAIIKNIEEFLPFRDEAIVLFTIISQYAPTLEIMQKTHRFFESLIPFVKPNQSTAREADNFRFLVHELFLYAFAVFLKHDRFLQAKYLLQQPYYFPGNYDYGQDVVVSHTVFRQYVRSLDDRKERLRSNRLSPHGDLLKERCKGTGIDFRDLMQADFVAFMRAEIAAPNAHNGWWPETLLYAGDFPKAFEIFARSISRAYFDNVKGLLAIDSPEELEPLFDRYRNGARRLPRWEYEGFDPEALLGYKQLATRP